MTAANDSLKQRLLNLTQDTTISETARREIYGVLAEIETPLDTDRWIYRLVVIFLGSVVLLTVIGGIVLTWRGGNTPNWQLPQGIIAIGSAAVGALTGLLAPSPTKS